MPPVREVTVLAAGGTIAMAGEGGAQPRLDAAALVAAVPALAGVAGLRARTLGSWPGVHVSTADALEIARAAAAEAAAGRGVVLTHGTDTLEETAVLCDLLHGADAPIVLTGAIRPASASGADGPANLLDAVRAAGDGATAGLGAIVAFAGELHAARAVRKSDSVSPRAFSSPRGGPLGRVAEESVEVWSRPDRRPPLPVAQLDARVEVVAAGLGSDGALVEAALAAGADGLVAVVLGAGHAPPAFLAACRAAARSVPVVACVRPESGRVLRSTYGFEGAERDVRAAGLILAPALSPAAARITLLACLGAGHSRFATAAAFAPFDP
jgi:L-asparaginase